jgi:hypothetical protein
MARWNARFLCGTIQSDSLVLREPDAQLADNQLHCT